MWKKLLAVGLIIGTMLSGLMYMPASIEAAESTDVNAIIENQVKDFAKSINKSGADYSAALDMASHGVTGRGKKLSVGTTHALTATLMNAQLSQYTVIRGCSIAIEKMQEKNLSSIFGDAGCNFGKNNKIYYEAALFRKGNAAGEGSELIQTSRYLEYNKATNAYDNNLVWMVGSLEIHIYITKGTTTADSVVYNVKVNFEDDFDFDTKEGSVPREIASILGSVLFKEFRWTATAEFSLKVPNECTHCFGEWTRTQNQTCTQDGIEKRTCSSCKAVDTRTEAAKGHTYTSVVTGPTCTKGGYTTYTCTCGDAYVDKHTEAAGHQMGAWTTTKVVTCTEDGEEKRCCSNCSYVETQIIVASGHEMRDWTTIQELTCTQNGIKRSVCSNCIYFETRTETAPGHEYSVVITEVTCTRDGYKTHTCHCGDTYVDSHVEAFGHTWDEGIVILEPTENTKGQREFTCLDCGEKLIKNIPELNHEHVYEEIVTDSTCTEGGYTTHLCECEDSYITDETAPLDHDYHEWYTSIEATCTTQGEERRDCSRCEEYELQATEVAEHKHEATVTNPSCTEEGYTTYTCSCGDSYVADETEPTGHSYSKWQVATEATEDHPGTEERFCPCGERETREYTLEEQAAKIQKKVIIYVAYGLGTALALAGMGIAVRAVARNRKRNQ